MTTRDPSSPYVIRSAQFEALTDAREIRAQAQVEAHARLEEARREADALRQAAQAECAALRAEAREHAQAEIAAYMQSCENSLADLAFLIARRLIDDLPRDEKVMRLVRTALADLPVQMGLVVKVPVSEGNSLKMSLQQDDGVLAGLSVVECGTLKPGECILQHEQGQTRLDVTAQLRALWQGTAA